MDKYFASNYSGSAFELFGTAHLVALACIVVLTLLLLPYRNKDDQQKRNIRILLALILWANEIAWHYWNYVSDTWTLQTMLPLQTCSLAVWFAGWMLLFKSYRIYEFVYLLGIGGAIQALATPGLGIYGFPHFVFFQYFISHGLIIVSAIYMTVVERFRPTWKSLVRVAIWANIYLVIIYFVNLQLGSNYLMINGKPNTPSILDLLPPWPIYILYMEAIGILTFLILYLPFPIRDWYTKFKLNKETSKRLDNLLK